MKRTLILTAAISVFIIAMSAGGGFRLLASALGDWLTGTRTTQNATAANDGRDVGAGFRVQQRAAGSVPLAVAGSASANIDALNNDPKAQLARAQERFDRVNEIYENYRKQTAYPFDSRPARENLDQMYPNAPIIEDRKLKEPGKKASQTVRLKTSQERIYVAGDETVLITVAALDENNNQLPINFTRGQIYDPPREGKPARRNPTLITPNDQGERGDLTKDDFTYSFRVAPRELGYATYSGLLRFEMNLTVAEQPGFLYFDMYYSPDAPATWAGNVREALEKGSLNFYLPVAVKSEGRYVITGRIDDAKGQPFALVTFNDVLTPGVREVKLNLFGKLVIDEAPAFPLTLRDVDGFLLVPDADPDRVLMQRKAGKQHVSRNYALTSFSDAEWDSEERRRYLEEYGRDVETARAHLEHIRRTMKP